ncbi:MAG: metal-dependent hydrolase [Cyclobacteriaceae bacterium]|nr:metal-dependent hydrolase [Cyclobacteriaceae bacterium]MCH8516636.1 metal-dependent hydrolase [Cyclobacteriaceae bacterium]
MEITFYGHSCFEINTGEHRILFDPFISHNEKASAIDVNKLKPDFVFLSHGHEDHVADAVKICKNSGAKAVSTFEVISWLGNQGVENTHPMNHGGSWEFDFGKVKLVNAVHSSSFPDGSYAGNPAGFVFTLKNGDSFYYAGDTALTYDMKLIGEEFELNFAFLPIGDNFTMNLKDAVKSAEMVGVNKFIGMHYDTFPYIEIDQEESKRFAKEKGKELVLMQIGETIKI